MWDSSLKEPRDEVGEDSAPSSVSPTDTAIGEFIGSAQEEASQDEWRRWLQQEYQQSAEESEQTQQDWALWRAFETATDRWLQQKGIAPAEQE